MLAVLRRNRALRFLWSGELVSMVGDWLTYVAISLLALERGEGLLAVAAVLVAHTLPNAALSPFAGYVVDRLDRRTVLVGASVGRGALTLGMAAAAHAGNLWAVQGLFLCRTALSAFHEPASQATLGRIMPEEDLMPANALLAATWSAVFALGVAVGGFVAAVLSPAAVMLVDAGTFFLAAGLLARLPSIVADRRGEATTAPRSTFVADLREAWRYATSRPPLARTVLGKLPLGLATGGAWVALNVSARSAPWLTSTALTLGVMHALRAVGTGVGPALWMRTIEGRKPPLPFELATLVAFAGVAMFLQAPAAGWAACGLLVWGMGGGANWVVTSTRIQSSADDAVRGRLSGLDLFGMTAGLCTGALLAASLGERLGVLAGAWATLGVAGVIVLAARVLYGAPRTVTA